MDTTVYISSSSLDDDGILNLSRNLCKTIQDEADISANLKSSEQKTGEKGDPVTIGVIVLSFITSGAAVALFEVIKSYFDRDSELVLEFPQENGKTIKINAKNLSKEQVNRAIGIVEKSME